MNNMIQNYTTYNTIQNYTIYNTIQNYTTYNTIQNYTIYNTIQNYTTYNTIQNYTTYNTIQNYTRCTSISYRSKTVHQTSSLSSALCRGWMHPPRMPNDEHLEQRTWRSPSDTRMHSCDTSYANTHLQLVQLLQNVKQDLLQTQMHSGVHGMIKANTNIQGTHDPPLCA